MITIQSDPELTAYGIDESLLTGMADYQTDDEHTGIALARHSTQHQKFVTAKSGLDMNAINAWCMKHNVNVNDTVNAVYDGIDDRSQLHLLKDRDLRKIENRQNVLPQGLLDFCRSSQHYTALIPLLLTATKSKTKAAIGKNLSNFQVGEDTHLLYLTLLNGFLAFMTNLAITASPAELATQYCEILKMLIEVATTALIVQRNDQILESVKQIWCRVVDPTPNAIKPNFEQFNEHTLKGQINMARYTNMGSPNRTELEGFKTGLAKGVCYSQAHMFERCQGCRLDHRCIWCHSMDHKLSVVC